MLYKLAPKQVENLYLPDAPDVKAAKEEFLKLFRNRPDSLMTTVNKQQFSEKLGQKFPN
jgi:hypothetical protein